jgi:hypothetical protein
MQKPLATVVVLVLLIAGLGYWRGWFELGSKTEEGNVQANLKVDVSKFKQDKESFKKLLTEKSRVMKEKLADLKEKTKSLAGDAKAKVEKEIATLTKKHEAVESKIKDVETSTEDKFDGLKKSAMKDIEEDEPGKDK